MSPIYRRGGDLKTKSSREDLDIFKKDPLALEKIKAFRATFESKISQLNWKTVGITSAVSGEGKTVLTTRLAIELATTGNKKILVLDLDLRKTDLGNYFGISSFHGLTDFLFGNVQFKNIIHNSHHQNLYIIPKGSLKIESPSDLFSGNNFRNFLKQLKNNFDVILIDTPPVLPVADTLSLRDQVDCFIFLFRMLYTPYNMFKQALEEVGEKNIMGVVINAVTQKEKKYYYNYYSSYYNKDITKKESDDHN